jgi:alkylation response protein AidB-like acyl-CoA dehydrogenase
MTDDLEQFRKEARAWLEANADPRPALVVTDEDGDVEWGVGDDDVSVFHAISYDEEQARVAAARKWMAAKFAAGYAMINWSAELGGRGLPGSYVRAFNNEESRFVTPNAGEIVPTSIGLIATTIAAYGTAAQKQRWIPSLMRGDEFGCQLFSEPSAGSDLASVTTRATRDGDEWVLNGQKVWTSSARHCKVGLAITRSNWDVPKHKGLTAFLVPLDGPGVEIRPIQQMTGGANFNEVFLTDVRLRDDEARLGPEGEGWRVALTCLGFERDHSGGNSGGAVGGNFRKVLAAARHFERTDEPVIRQALVDVYIGGKVMQYTTKRAAAALKAGQTPGPEGSLGKLMWTQNMRRVSDTISLVLGPRLVADSGEWGTYAWSQHVLGAPGYRIAGGSDEIQRNIIGERVLGLPAEPRVDKDVAFSEAQRLARG